MRPYFIGIAGPSGAGKTSLAAALSRRLSGAATIPTDCYYLGLDHLSLDERKRLNFDDPALLDWPLLIEHMKSLSQGRAIRRPIYSFELYSRLPETTAIRPAQFVLIEGIFTLHAAALRTLLDLKIFVAAPDELCFQRRLWRDTHERGRTPESVIHQYETMVRPSAESFVLPTLVEADVTVRGDLSLRESLRTVLDWVDAAASVTSH